MVTASPLAIGRSSATPRRPGPDPSADDPEMAELDKGLLDCLPAEAAPVTVHVRFGLPERQPALGDGFSQRLTSSFPVATTGRPFLTGGDQTFLDSPGGRDYALIFLCTARKQFPGGGHGPFAPSEGSSCGLPPQTLNSGFGDYQHILYCIIGRGLREDDRGSSFRRCHHAESGFSSTPNRSVQTASWKDIHRS